MNCRECGNANDQHKPSCNFGFLVNTIKTMHMISTQEAIMMNELKNRGKASE